MRHRHAFQSMYWLLRCTFGKNSENRFLTKMMFRFINWYHNARNPLLERVEATANLIMGKDLIHYTRKPASGNGTSQEAEGPVSRRQPLQT
jgi:hypothetical protein